MCAPQRVGGLDREAGLPVSAREITVLVVEEEAGVKAPKGQEFVASYEQHGATYPSARTVT